MRRALVGVALLVGSPAGADDYKDRYRHAKPARVTASLDGDTARFTVRYVVQNVPERGVETYALPDRGLVTAASVIERGRRRPLALVPAEKASERYNALFEKPPGEAPTRAVVIDTVPYRNELAIGTALPSRTEVVVETEIAAPTCYYRDARYVAVPPEWISRLPADRRVKPSEALDEACTDDHGTENAWIAFPARQLAAQRAAADRVGFYGGRVALGKAQIVKLEVNLAAKLSEVPRDLATAIVVDASRSLSFHELEAQRETVAAYLRAVPHSRVQVIAYARRARPLLPSWMDATHAMPRVERELAAIRPENGSAVEAGLREAAKWLAQTPGTRRILLFTDENLASRTLHTRVADEAIPPNTLVHVVALGGEGLARDDAAALARLAAKTRGLSVRGGAKPADVDLDATLLARPIALDRVVVRTPGFAMLESGLRCPHEDHDEPDELREGSSCTWWGQGSAVSAPFVVEGFLWGERMQRVLRPDAARSLDLVRELSTRRILDEDLHGLALRAARAVNEVWSLYVAWGGTDGYEDGYGFGMSSYGSTCGGCRGGTIGTGFGTGTLGKRPDLESEFRRIVEAACKPARAMTVEVETTFEEIVDVEVDATDDVKTCATEALWNAWLVMPGAPQHAVTRIRVGP